MIELFIEGYKADITEDISTLLTFQIDDIRNFGSRETTFSKTIVLPGTSNNNKIFGHIFKVISSNAFDPTLNNIGYNFNASKSANAYLFQGNIQQFKGVLRLLQINNYQGRTEYEVAVFGDLHGLNVYLSNALIEDLDFSAYDHIYNETNIVASWDNVPGSGYYYPLIDYGTYSTVKHDWDYLTFRPALYVKEYIDKMFEAAGFTYSSALFSTARFKGLIIPHNQKELRSLTSQVIQAYKTTPQTIIDTGTGNTFDPVMWDTTIAGSFTYLAGLFTYNDPTSIPVTLTWDLRGTRQATTNGSFTIYIKVNSTILAQQSFSVPPGGMNVPYTYLGSTTTVLNQNDVVQVFYQYDGIGTNMVVTVQSPSSFLADASAPIFSPVTVGGTVTLNDAIPKNIKQIDFFVSIIQLFNLYVYEDTLDKNLLHIEPYVDFFDLDASTATDWTYKVDRNKVITLKPMSELNSKLYNFQFKSDSDYYNDLYKKRYNLNYGDRVYDSEFEFAQEATTVTLIFSPTPLVGYGGEEKVYPTIFKLTNNVEETIDSNIRIMQTKKITGVASWNILDGASVLTSSNVYGYAGHLDDPDAPANDLNFGTPEELFFVLLTGDLSVNQFNVYWSPYMAEITDKDSKLLACTLRLTRKDIEELDFSKFKYIDGALWRLNKIIDYNATKEDVCKVELLKTINLIY